MSNDLQKIEASSLQVFTKSKFKGVADSLSTNDIQIPTLMLMQANSTFVQEYDHINSGDFLHSITYEVWGSRDKKKVELVFFDMFKSQIISDVSNGKKKWLETKNWSPEMELDNYEEILGDTVIRKEKCYNYAVYRAEDLRAVTKPDGSQGHVASPIIVKFKGGSMKNGKRLNQVFQDYASFEAPSWATTFFLTATLEEKDGSKYWVYNFERGRQTSEIEQLAAEKLCEQMNKAKQDNNLKVIDDEEQPEQPVVKNYAKDIC